MLRDDELLDRVEAGMRMIERLSERWETEVRVGGAKGRAVRTGRLQVDYAAVIGRD